MLTLLLTISAWATTPDRARVRDLYRIGCASELSPPPGLRAAAGALTTETADAREVGLGLNRLRRRVEMSRLGDVELARFLFNLADFRHSPEIEALFFSYVDHPGNERVARQVLGHLIDVVLTEVATRRLSDGFFDRHVALIVRVLRADPSAESIWNHHLWTLIDGEFVDQEGILHTLEVHRRGDEKLEEDAAELATQIVREPPAGAADLMEFGARPNELRPAQYLAVALRLDAWVRRDARLSRFPPITDVRGRVGRLLTTFTWH